MKAETSVGPENFSRFFNNPNNDIDSLDSAVSVGTAAPGESRGTGNHFFGVKGKLSSTLAYWRSVFPRLYGFVQVLCGSGWQRRGRELTPRQNLGGIALVSWQQLIFADVTTYRMWRLNVP